MRWRRPIASVRRFHPGWQRITWTDEIADAYVAVFWPQLIGIFRGFPRGIMRADVIRYVAMHDIGGLYCDLDYEFVRSFDYGRFVTVLSLEFDRSEGDQRDSVAGHVFASAPFHPFWRDVLDDVQTSPPQLGEGGSVVTTTGPGLLSRVYFANAEKYHGLWLSPRSVFSPNRIRGHRQMADLLANPISVGFHHACGSWKRRWSLEYWRHRLRKVRASSTRRRAA